MEKPLFMEEVSKGEKSEMSLLYQSKRLFLSRFNEKRGSSS